MGAPRTNAMTAIPHSEPEYRARRGNGRPINPGDAVVPVLEQIAPGRLSVVGTGFYVTRYGLFITAAHVFDDLDWKSGTMGRPAYVCHLAGEDQVHLRRVLRVSKLDPVDLAIGQADNFLESFPHAPLENLGARLSVEVPKSASSLVTFAYPENALLDFTQQYVVPTIKGDYFAGKMLRLVKQSENPFLPYPHFETTIEIRSGASGGPVFDDRGRIIGVNCRSWDFRGSEHEGDNLSSVVPIGGALPLEFELTQLPPMSWECAQVPLARRGCALRFAELAAYGHVLFEPPVHPTI
jgi:hypothetical protein